MALWVVGPLGGIQYKVIMDPPCKARGRSSGALIVGRTRGPRTRREEEEEEEEEAEEEEDGVKRWRELEG
eukprot:1283626-Pyramimonas_sp.AAC.1